MRGLVVFGNNPFHFLVYEHGCLFAVVLMSGELLAYKNLFLSPTKSQRSYVVAHTPFADHLSGQFGCPFKVASCPGGQVLEEKLFGRSSSQQNPKLAFEVLFGVVVAVIDGELLGNSQSSPAGDYGDLVNGVAAGCKHSHQGVSGFVIGGVSFFFVADDKTFPLNSHKNFIFSPLEIFHIYCFFIQTRSSQGGFVNQIGYVCP